MGQLINRVEARNGNIVIEFQVFNFFTMERYKNKSGNSGVTFYEIGFDYIKLRFKNSTIYTYNNLKPGKQKLDSMKRLALEGIGLSTYISREVGDDYYKKEG